MAEMVASVPPSLANQMGRILSQLGDSFFSTSERPRHYARTFATARR